MNTLVYVITSAAYAGAGYAAGYTVGRAARALQSIDRKVSMDHTGQTPAAPARAARRRWRALLDKPLGVLLIVLSALSVASAAVQTFRYGELASCQAEWNKAYAAALRERQDAAATERRAQRELLTFMLSGPTKQQAREALQRYVDGLADADRQREGAPLPSERCD